MNELNYPNVTDADDLYDDQTLLTVIAAEVKDIERRLDKLQAALNTPLFTTDAE